ncbi:PREDICTED: FERM domain-containing protein 8 [Ceratosolen solmsi marchali]|uniref:FERM domain-containing protein 8 n=1 Tax=Ceratosolen solmsi marchali TaxID=326594 RepID=A0AAJ6YTC4_9HYME|nr:PREDICTED: FERM domain-containing protein 8 [Ceratosolen solmsi marchali]XP_011503868.1 PREDICTED: FERM domain-containing protein 8 [Ceratosolen solmsi marchali]
MNQQDRVRNLENQAISHFQQNYKADGVCSTQTCIQQKEKSTICIAVYLMSEVCLTIDLERNATAQQIINIIQAETELGLIRTSPLTNTQPVFALWLCSSQLEVQLRPVHKPLELAIKWPRLVNKYGSQKYKDNDEEPLLYFRRNIFLSRRDEEQIKEPKIMELLYAEANRNVLDGRYPCESQARYASLGALQARIELGPYNVQAHTLTFFRKHRGRFLPHHYNSPSLLLGLGFGLGLVGGKGAPEARLLEQYKRIPNHSGTSTNPRKLLRKYLEFCWGLPCYGAAFFQGQIERPVRGLASWITNHDLPVLIAINTIGVYIVDDSQCSLLLSLRYSELNWEMAKPSDEGNPDCLPCLFLQFPVRENGARVFKILQVFSKQAIMMDTLISGFAEGSKQSEINDENVNVDRLQNNSMLSNIGSFTNKLSKFTLATFDEEGHCIGQMGSWSIQ